MDKLFRVAYVEDKDIIELDSKIKAGSEPRFQTADQIYSNAQDIIKNYDSYFKDKGHVYVSESVITSLWDTMRERYCELGGKDSFPEIDPGLQGASTLFR